MDRVILVIAGVVIALITGSCVTTRPGPFQDYQILSMNVSSADTTTVLEAMNIFAALDTLSLQSLEMCRDMESVRRLMDRFQKANPQRWELVQTRLAYCRQKGYGLLNSDVRVRMVLAYGPPDIEWPDDKCTCSSKPGACPTWVYTWRRGGVYPNGKTLVCEGDPGKTFPTRVLMQRDLAAPEMGTLYPFVLPYTLLYGDAGNFAVGLEVSANELSQRTLEEAILRFEVRVYKRDSVSCGPLVTTLHDAIDLQELRAKLAVIDSTDWRYLGATTYIACPLPPGDYRLFVKAWGDEKNNGETECDVTIDGDTTMSELVLVRTISGTGYDSGVVSAGQNFYAVARTEFVPGITVGARLEFILPPEFKHRFFAQGALIRIPEGPRKERTSEHVSSLPISYCSDENGRPYGNSVYPTDFFVDPPTSRDMVFSQVYKVTDNNVVLFQSVVLNRPTGLYLFRVSITSTDGKILDHRDRYLRIISPALMQLSAKG
ncbi:MAG: hypothetical protein A2898_03720 [Candidatus Kerfeldbacteria bacterium RIFCSPLOWO2_01_FULL_48_11]|uniref:Uncharacterized protein n=1 Tax=Candidatus Kerfeldbacteria bacterium RIFCSPLOWO2_01_FULL_48_11 TaxID=1798543 RepID=A0A1G2B6G2_9BACT|nr:MAG: hypothetical protein UY34_C0018G0021 [Parcubacteria group bacterium GW2011_GWA2_48_9]KKW15859.1 MAG: hypothetical protein UY52_C0013G0015 [Parcubacteria group bacterium GW2011_GWC2_49_9]OGY84798.1 MAG: hypothetical protein A2898_03720 [Candidatus Kerfeldbacteria bacterium RIFCSPLOWO2_01_FULL_48_11]HCJ52866.1 hypothetical protein [Candidatus Kerfeldbacteria bacterium]HCM67460.1 hypothetical protein [Candidatus Kerfeldbacteria bacterium]